jgi:allantoicase
MSHPIPSSAPVRVPFMDLLDLASEKVGGRVLSCSDDFFAEKENLLKATPAVFIPDKYTERGKWMDGWESRRKRVPGHDSCVIALGIPGVIAGFEVDTSFFTGNYPEYCSIEGSSDGGSTWKPLLGKTKLHGNTRNLLPNVFGGGRVTHLRLHSYPDGGIARLRVYGEAVPDWDALIAGTQDGLVDVACAAHGGVVIAASDMHYGAKDNVLFPARATHMGEGWETRRSRGANHDWLILRLGRPATVGEIEVDTNHFKGNFPESCRIEGCVAPAEYLACDFRDQAVTWREILPRQPLQAHTQHRFRRELTAIEGAISHLRVTIFPDGGISRLRVLGKPQ